MSKENREVVEKTVSRFVELPDKCKNFILGYMIGVQQSRRNADSKKSA